jgi:hypothetical protein
MRNPRPRPGRPRWLRLPRRTARLRLTVLYGGAVFLACGATVLAVTYLLYGQLGNATPPALQGRAGGDDGRPRLYGGPMASVRQFQVTFDCAEPERVARFWCEVLGYVVPPPPEGFATWDDFDRALPPERQGSAFACTDPSGAGPRLFFQRVPEGKVVKNRLHLDVRAGTGLVGEERLAALEAECARLAALGAVRVRLLPADGGNESCLVMQDIEGNEFCLD